MTTEQLRTKMMLCGRIFDPNRYDYDYWYCLSCVEADGKATQQMVDDAKDVTLKTLRRHCYGLKDWEKSMGYGRENGLLLKDDWAVSFHKSKYQGNPCYFIRHSSIEYIWMKQREYQCAT